MVNHLLSPKPGANLAFVLGNGQSRLQIDLQKIKKIGTVYGCNALYREFQPDYLVAVDTKMIDEIVESGYHQSNSVWTNPKKHISQEKNINFFNPSKGWSSGPTALWLAAQHGHREIYILGFDYQGNNGLVNNVYAGTNNYKQVNEKATYYGNWLNQTESVIKEFKMIKFVRVVDSGSFLPENLVNIKLNFQHWDYNQFKKEFNL